MKFSDREVKAILWEVQPICDRHSKHTETIHPDCIMVGDTLVRFSLP